MNQKTNTKGASYLDQFAYEIRTMRERHKSYRAISQYLSNKGCDTDPKYICKFVKQRFPHLITPTVRKRGLSGRTGIEIWIRKDIIDQLQPGAAGKIRDLIEKMYPDIQ